MHAEVHLLLILNSLRKAVSAGTSPAIDSFPPVRNHEARCTTLADLPPVSVHLRVHYTSAAAVQGVRIIGPCRRYAAL